MHTNPLPFLRSHVELKDLKSETKLDVKSDFGIMIFVISHKTPHLRRPFELDVVYLFV